MKKDNDQPEYSYGDETALALKSLAGFVEKLIHPSTQHASVLQGISRVQYVLRRMPKRTSGISGSLDISLRVNEELRYLAIGVDEGEVRLSQGGSMYDPHVGSDSYSSDVFCLQPDGVILGSAGEIYDWLDEAAELLNLGALITIEAINDGDEIDWNDAEEEIDQ